ncbi:MAG: aspartate aminotransferase family protein [Cyclobacteriaceae bacterium]
MPFTFTNSERLYATGQSLIPAGVNSNTRSRAPHPLYFREANGAYVRDADNNHFLDILMGNGAILLGHNHPEVQDAVKAVLEKGLTTGVESEETIALAEKFLSIVKTQDRVRFCNSGTEAALHALRLARFATGRTRLAKAEGSYHGWSDDVFVSVWSRLSDAGTIDYIQPLPGTPGQLKSTVDQVVVLPFNDIDRSVAAIERHAKDLAAVILEPVLIDIGFIPATKEYLQALRDVCDKHGIVLIFDELLTGFNLAPGGVQEIEGVVPDLAMYGKALGNGYPIAAIAGKEHLMEMLSPGKGPVFVGTFNGHALSVGAAHAVLSLLEDGSVQKTVSARLQYLKSTFNADADKIGIEARMEGGGSHFQWYFTKDKIHDYRTATTTNAVAYKAFVQSIFEQGVLFLPNPLSHHAISLAHDGGVIEQLTEIFRNGLQTAAKAI